MEDHVFKCIACAEPMLAGQGYFRDYGGGFIHAECCGPEPEGFVKDLDTGEHLGPDDPIPTPDTWGDDQSERGA